MVLIDWMHPSNIYRLNFILKANNVTITSNTDKKFLSASLRIIAAKKQYKLSSNYIYKFAPGAA
jgi:hypothetical protein